MKKIIQISLIILYFSGYAQEAKLAVANKKYEKFFYVDAIKIYEKVANKGYQSSELFKKLGNSYYYNGELEKSVEWYQKLFALNEDVEPEYYFRHSQALKTIQNYEEATIFLEKYYQKTNSDRLDKVQNYLAVIDQNSNRFLIDTTTINTQYYDFGPAFYNDAIVFTSSRPDIVLVKKTHKWTNQNFTDLYISKIRNDSILSEPENFSTAINSKFNEASPVFTKDGKTMYFTRNNYLVGKKGKDKGMDKQRTTLIKIYRAELINGEWTNIKELPFNSDCYSTAHPALSLDEKTLYFSSDRPGTIGGADIFKVTIHNNKYSKPENLGLNINTKGRESFPFIGPNNSLYFASDGHLGLGGLDIFESKIIDNEFQAPTNIGKPINSSFDDFGFIINEMNRGFFTSNRKEGKGFDDIYQLTTCFSKLNGQITDLITNEIIPNATILLLDDNENVISETKSDENGNYKLELNCKQKYFIRVKKEDFETTEKVATPLNNDKTTIDLKLNRTVFPITEGTDLAKVFDISIIFFDLDKWNIRPDAARDIQKVIEVMNEYPNMHISIRSHTDSRQTHAYNELLSDRRAKSTLQFMVLNGIDKERLTAQGFGENQLVNECADSIYCSEEEHQKNRRSEFIITKIE
ncbi:MULTISPECIES: OmpA family protein [Flavobacterium]|uniref:OmpA family protein n=1 Tax=Flavobacterium jumunjinense TaxID=998845 RepID=A0ABV5GQN9_9FLAO|nr:MULTISPECIES: OmpA family protein [Flavobacterium]